MLTMYAIFSGKVQGVGFRAKACLFASTFFLKGYVKNLPSGSVELVVQGAKKDLEKFLGKIKENFSISHVEAEWKENAEVYKEFQILR